MNISATVFIRIRQLCNALASRPQPGNITRNTRNNIVIVVGNFQRVC